MLKCFNGPIAAESFDRTAFKLQHQLLDHPALGLDNLARVLPRLPQNQVLHSQGLMQNGDDFEGIFKREASGSIEAIIENIRTMDAYIMVRSPETDSSFAPLYHALRDDVETLMKKRGAGKQAIDAKLYLFIASPNSITPFHIDRYSTLLLQFRGSKEMTVFAPWDERVVSPPHKEAYVTYKNTRLPWTPELDALGTRFRFEPGEALHIPFSAGHHVKNGGDDISISMSIIFNTDESMVWRRALAFNHAARRLGMTPAPVGQGTWRDRTKSTLWQAKTRLDALRG